MGLRLEYRRHRLRFKFDAGTSRGVLKEKDTWIIKLFKQGYPVQIGLGECGPLAGLSMDNLSGMDAALAGLTKRIEGSGLPVTVQGCLDFAAELVPAEFPSIRFGLETALLDLLNGGCRLIFPNRFAKGNWGIPINGLVWMGEKEFMLSQVDEKINQGFTCIKMKIGALDFEEELSVLKEIRTKYKKRNLTIRVDANGAFSGKEAMVKLEALSAFDIHSIEQPIAAGQYQEMARLCQSSPIPIALDEELIDIFPKEEKDHLLDKIKPAFIILKPGLLGGIQATREWIDRAETRNIGWWVTSALESNIGLNAIAQLTAEYPASIPQGLGTGGLYFNNFESPLSVSQGLLNYHKHKNWSYKELADFI